jgi:hypothetical protein
MTLTWRRSTCVLVRNSNRPGAGTLAVTPTQLGARLADLTG